MSGYCVVIITSKMQEVNLESKRISLFSSPVLSLREATMWCGCCWCCVGCAQRIYGSYFNLYRNANVYYNFHFNYTGFDTHDKITFHSQQFLRHKRGYTKRKSMNCALRIHHTLANKCARRLVPSSRWPRDLAYTLQINKNVYSSVA